MVCRTGTSIYRPYSEVGRFQRSILPLLSGRATVQIMNRREALRALVSGYPSSACQNPTLTMMALASRSCDYLIEEYRAGRT